MYGEATRGVEFSDYLRSYWLLNNECDHGEIIIIIIIIIIITCRYFSDNLALEFLELLRRLLQKSTFWRSTRPLITLTLFSLKTSTFSDPLNRLMTALCSNPMLIPYDVAVLLNPATNSASVSTLPGVPHSAIFSRFYFYLSA